MSYIFPNTALLFNARNDIQFTSQEYVMADAKRLQQAFKAYKLGGTITDNRATPFSITFDVAPDLGVSVKDFRSLHGELEMCLGSAVEISTISDKICITKKNPVRPIICLRSVLESKEFKENDFVLPIAIGVDIYGKNLCVDLASTPHMLIAGTTGSGKTVFLDDIILSLLYTKGPDEVNILIIDPKECDFGIYNGIPHLISPVISDADEAFNAICGIEDEMMRRYELFSKVNTRDIATFNTKVPKEKKLPRIVFIIDEYMDLMARSKSEMEEHIARIARLARAAGIHLVLATQRPTAKVITPSIKANLPCRASFTTVDGRESRAIIDKTGAQKLLGNGDMLFSNSDNSVPIHAQAALVTVPEIKKVVAFLSKQS